MEETLDTLWLLTQHVLPMPFDWSLVSPNHRGWVWNLLLSSPLLKSLADTAGVPFPYRRGHFNLDSWDIFFPYQMTMVFSKDGELLFPCGACFYSVEGNAMTMHIWTEYHKDADFIPCENSGKNKRCIFRLGKCLRTDSWEVFEGIASANLSSPGSEAILCYVPIGKF